MGESSDIVNKGMFLFEDRGGRCLTLRLENTAGVVRAYVEHSLAQEGLVQKLYYMGPQFPCGEAAEGPLPRVPADRRRGAGRSRPRDGRGDFDLPLRPLLAARFHGAPRVSDSVGTDECRPAYVDALRAFLAPLSDSMGEDDRRRLEQNPLRVLDTKDPALAERLADAPQMLAFLDDESLLHHRTLLAQLDEAAIPYTIEPRLVRGLDYYTRTVFEVTAPNGAQNALLGGGRYDRLVSDLGGPKTPGIGFAIGEDRLVSALPEAFRTDALLRKGTVALVALGEDDRADALALARKLRAAGIAVDFDPRGRGPGDGLKAAGKGHALAVLVGSREREQGIALVKNLALRTQDVVPRAELVTFLKGKISS